MIRARRAAAALAAVLAAGCAGPAPTPPPPAAGGSPAAAPALALEPSSFDFGRVLPDRALHKDVRLRNLGRGPVAIESVTTDCGCMVVGQYARELAPGGSTVLKVQLQTPSQPGAVVRTLVVRTASPNPASFQLQLRATVVEEAKPAS